MLASASVNSTFVMDQLQITALLVCQAMQPVEASPFQDEMPYETAHLSTVIPPALGPGTWPCPAQMGMELQWKHSSLNSTESTACDFTLLEPRVRPATRTALKMLIMLWQAFGRWSLR